MKARSSYPTINSKTFIMPFGKHKGIRIEWILQNDPGYILWLSDEKVCKVSNEILDEAESYQEEKDFVDAMRDSDDFDNCPWMDD